MAYIIFLFNNVDLVFEDFMEAKLEYIEEVRIGGNSDRRTKRDNFYVPSVLLT